MTRSVETIRIEAPPPAVFAALADPATHPVWRPSVVEFRADSVPIAAGTRIVETVRFLGRRYTTIFEVTELEAPRTLALRSVEGPLPTELRCELVPVAPAATDLRFVLEMKSPRPLGLPVPGFHALMRWYLRDEGRHLARLVEQGAA